MNIGQKINEFDISDGTVQSFNKIFPNSPIKDRMGFLEIGDIVGVGGETKRFITLFSSDTEGNEEVRKLTVDLAEALRVKEYRKAGSTQASKGQGRGARYNYTVYDKDKKVIMKTQYRAKIAEKMGVSESYVRRRTIGETQQRNDVYNQDFHVIAEKIK